MMNQRDTLMRKVQMYSFAVYDAMLYLDSHPDSRCALDYYNKNKKLERQAVEEYERHFGPLTAPMDADSWQWTKGPWPWQCENDWRE
ncbi:MAG: spore coat protein CotJB [Clostridia bacterium]|nr:spore coat protein CotJB [Clostridia bacterium]